MLRYSKPRTLIGRHIPSKLFRNDPRLRLYRQRQNSRIKSFWAKNMHHFCDSANMPNNCCRTHFFSGKLLSLSLSLFSSLLIINFLLHLLSTRDTQLAWMCFGIARESGNSSSIVLRSPCYTRNACLCDCRSNWAGQAQKESEWASEWAKDRAEESECMRKLFARSIPISIWSFFNGNLFV